MLLQKLTLPRLCGLLIACAILSSPVYSQQNNSDQNNADQNNSSSQSQNDTDVEGTVVASSRITFVVRSDDNQFHVYTFDRNTRRPQALAVGTRVRVASDQGDQEGARHATDVSVMDRPQAGGSAEGGSANSSARRAAPIPPAVRNTENNIRREARRWRLGGRVGVGLDPELIMFGLHSQMGPIFSRSVFFRPNADFAWGEVTDMVALNLEGVYRMPTAIRGGAWAPYFGAGPSLNFIHQSFKTSESQARNISFGNFDYQTGFNVLIGMQNRHGVFFEAKTSLYAQPAPILRLIVGRNF